MPKRTDLARILLIGSGPIVIGQGAEFDYSGTQAVKALKEEGYTVILVNSNPATIMTDPELADRTYIEPVTPEWVRKVIERERPDALLPTMAARPLSTSRWRPECSRPARSVPDRTRPGAAPHPARSSRLGRRSRQRRGHLGALLRTRSVRRLRIQLGHHPAGRAPRDSRFLQDDVVAGRFVARRPVSIV